MNTSHLSYAKVLVCAACLLALGLTRSDAMDVPPSVLISYIGAWQEPQDRVFARFKEALRLRHPELTRDAAISHVHVPAGDDAGLERAIRKALDAHPAVLVTPTGRSSLMARKLAGATPVVFSSYTDPVRAGIRESLQYCRRRCQTDPSMATVPRFE